MFPAERLNRLNSVFSKSPMPDRKNIAILGSTGSIGQNALSVIHSLPGYRIYGLTGHSRVELLLNQARKYAPEIVVFSDRGSASDVSIPALPGTSVSYGKAGIIALATHEATDIVVAAIVGRAGLESTWAAIGHGKRVALANKETMVVAGSQIMKLAAETGAEIIPVDSEHSALFQCLHSGNHSGNGNSSEVSRLILTASGGPFREFDSQQMNCVTVEQALNHPTWEMGPKITIDSATMMNKALEIIEARWLFGIDPAKIEVVVHPQSIVHSMVEFCDGSVISQMSPPDMKLPIQYALTYPDRIAGDCPRLDFESRLDLEFHPPDFDRFPALKLGYEVARQGGTTGAVLNGANEAAVAAFLNKEISFTDIVAACREVLDNHEYESNPSLEALLAQDVWAREEINKWIAC